uniref:Uncharacterized protein n=1 Tax=Arundo donax TaxID=35708 RepID=A0A0A9DAZ7_ARUDO
MRKGAKTYFNKKKTSYLKTDKEDDECLKACKPPCNAGHGMLFFECDTCEPSKPTLLSIQSNPMH